MTTALAGYRIDAAGSASGPDGEPVHLARRRPGPAVDGEVAALTAAAGPHVPRLIDVATAPNGDVVLVTEHLPHRLTDLLQVAGWPSPGEAVTVLAPLAQAVSALGAARLRHGAIGPSAVRFDDAGRPVLAGFDGAGPLGPNEDTAVDEQAIRLLAETLLERCGAGDAARRTAVDRPAPAALAELLFDSADPRPVRLRPVPPARTEPPARLVEVPVAAPSQLPEAVGRSPLDVARRIGRSGLRHAGTVRPRVWALAGGSAALLVAAAVLLPAGPDRGAAAAESDHRAAHPTARPTGPATDPAPHRTTADPAVAVAGLLEARAACLETSRPACLATTDADGSPVLVDDTAALRSGAAAPMPAGVPHTLRTAGSTAVVAVGDDTVLAVRQPGGWRLRDLVPGR